MTAGLSGRRKATERTASVILMGGVGIVGVSKRGGHLVCAPYAQFVAIINQ
jgi:hypothetical protein